MSLLTNELLSPIADLGRQVRSTFLRMRCTVGVVGCLFTLSRQTAVAQGGAAPPPVFSIGQPPRLEYDVALLAPLGTAGRSVPRVSVAAYHSLRNPVAGLLGVTGEIYAGGRRDAGLRVLAEGKSLALSGGVDWDVASSRADPLLSYRSAIRRGGLFGHGSMARVDWLPTRRSWAVGATIPVFRPSAGRTRPRETTVALRSSCQPPHDVVTSATSDAVVQRLRASAMAIGSFANAYTARASAVITGAGTYTGVMQEYDRAIHQLFEVGGLDSSAASAIAARGRAVLLDRVILPIDSLFGRVKASSPDLEPLACVAAAHFDRWLGDSARLAPGPRSAARGAFSVWLDVIENVYRDLAADARDSRLVWLPLDLALRLDDFDEQSEVDALLARAVGHPFTDQNALTYLRSADLPLEIARSIYATRRYHVLWTHDFTGRRESGATDNIGYSMVADAYLPALTAAVKRYDTTGVLPTYIILQDEYFYETRGNRLWMTILESPLDASTRLRGDTGEREAHLRARQQELRAAVAGSARLQQDAARSGDPDAWLRKVVKVHVNIVEPSDFAFRSHHIVLGIPFTPDNIMRDHRKLVMYDLNESDPYQGAMLLMGVGIGEHYASVTWEDRGYRIRGPATLEARRAVRDALLRNGFSERSIPQPLRAVASIDQAVRRSNVGDYVGRALQVHNEVGFGRKESSVARAMLYNLAPPGSVIVAPDPMWLSDTWAGMLVGAAARGCRVYIVAPSEANAPSPQASLMAVQHRILSRVLQLRDTLGRHVRAAGGDLRIGLFAARAGADDGVGRAREVREGLARSPWIRELIPFDGKTLAILESAEAEVATGAQNTTIARDEVVRAPQLHQKSQLIARPGAIAALVGQPRWDVALARAVSAQTEQTARFAEQMGYANPDVDTTATRRTDALLRGYEQTLTEADRRRVSFYFSLGTQNQDPRGIVSDAEATLIVSGVEASAGLVDLFFLMARSTWVESEATLSTYVRPRSGMLSRLAWLMRAAF